MVSEKEAVYTFEEPFIGGKSLLIPGSVKFLARRTLKSFRKQYRDQAIDFDKAESLLESLLTRQSSNPETGQRATHALCKQLSAKPFWEPADHALLSSIANSLVTSCEAIKNEYLQANQAAELAQEINTGKGFLQEKSWLNIRLGNLGNYTKKAQELFPETIALLEPFGQRIFSAEFIIMEPDTTLPPHTDATNAYLVGHLGLIVPEACAYQVKDCVKTFSQGDLVFFDQSFVHSAWNKGETRRVNLLLTLFHPEISDLETEIILAYIKKLQVRALLFSPIILVDYLLLKLFRFVRPKKLASPLS